MGQIRRSILPLSALAASLLVGCGGPGAEVEYLRAEVKERLPFDEESFTQGLEVGADGALYVGTGLEGSSRIYARTPQGDTLRSEELDPQFFGEGITLVDDSVWQLTWQSGTAIKRDANTLKETGRAHYDGEGWGVCHSEDARGLIFSDGTDELRRLDPETFEERDRFDVTLDGRPVPGLNELECVGGDVYANLFTETDIVRIDAKTGSVTAVIDASGLPNNAEDDPNNVLNGIAHIPGTGAETGTPDEFYLTGKRWPDMYRVTFEAAD